jgi:hypothetical protein
LFPKPMFIQGDKDGLNYEVAVQYNEGYQENISVLLTI